MYCSCLWGGLDDPAYHLLPRPLPSCFPYITAILNWTLGHGMYHRANLITVLLNFLFIYTYRNHGFTNCSFMRSSLAGGLMICRCTCFHHNFLCYDRPSISPVLYGIYLCICSSYVKVLLTGLHHGCFLAFSYTRVTILFLIHYSGSAFHATC